MHQPGSTLIDTNQLDNPIYVTIPMPMIILQIPSVRMTLSHEFSNGHHSGSNSRCAHYCHRQREEDEIKKDKVDEEIAKNYMKKEEIEFEEIEVEEIEVEEMIFQYLFNQQHDSNNYILPNDANLNESPLSPVLETDMKGEDYCWEQFSIE